MQSLDEWTATAAERGPSLAYYLQMCSMTDVDDPELVRLVDAGAPASKVKRLILEGTDVNATSNWGYTALYTAVLNNDVELVRLLLRHGARADYIDDDGDNLSLRHHRGDLQSRRCGRAALRFADRPAHDSHCGVGAADGPRRSRGCRGARCSTCYGGLNSTRSWRVRTID